MLALKDAFDGNDGRQHIIDGHGAAAVRTHTSCTRLHTSLFAALLFYIVLLNSACTTDYVAASKASANIDLKMSDFINMHILRCSMKSPNRLL